MATATGMTFKTEFQMVNLNKAKWEKGTKAAVNNAFKKAGIRYIEIITNFLPLRTGFLWGAFANLEAWTGKTVVNKGQLLQYPKIKKVKNKKTKRFRRVEVKQGAYLINRKTESALQYRIKVIEKQLARQEKQQLDLIRRREALDRKARHKYGDKKIKAETEKIGSANTIGTQTAEQERRKIERLNKDRANFQKQLDVILKRKKTLSEKIARFKTGAFRSRYVHVPGEQKQIPNPAAAGLSLKDRLKNKIPQYINVTTKGKKYKIDETDPKNFVDGYREYYTGGGVKVLKRPENGRAFSTPIANILTGSLKTQFVFRYNVNINYYYYNDNFYKGGDTPWHLSRAIESGFNIYLGRLTNSLSYVNYLYTIKTKVNGTSLTVSAPIEAKSYTPED